MRLISKSKIHSGKVKYFGQELIRSKSIEFKVGELNIPSSFSFNHSWEFYHKCANCGKNVSIYEDFEKNIKNFKIIPGINSLKYKSQVIEDICSIFEQLYVQELENIKYINRTDFKYEFEFQRKASVNLIEYSCGSCNSIYLGLIRIGYPLAAEKNLREGKLGKVEIDGIFQVNKNLDDFLRDIL